VKKVSPNYAISINCPKPYRELYTSDTFTKVSPSFKNLVKVVKSVLYKI